MRSRDGGFIGPPKSPSPYAGASGIWTLGEEYSARVSSLWPRNYLYITTNQQYADGTQYGSVSLTPTLNTNLSATSSWEKSTDSGATWSIVSGATTENLTLYDVTSASNGHLYRLKSYAGLRRAVSSAMQIRYETSFVVDWYQMGDQSGRIGDQIAFYGQANTMTGTLYGGLYSPSDMQWQQSTNGGSTWTDIAGQNYYFLYVTIAAGMNGRKYRLRARVSANHSWYASPASTLTVTP